MSSSDASHDSPIESNAAAPAPRAPEPAVHAAAAPAPAAESTPHASADAPASEGGPAGNAAAGDERRSRNRRGRGGRGRGGSDGARAPGPAGGAQSGAPAGGRRPDAAPRGGKAAKTDRQVHPLLEKLAALYPQLFGARFLPLQRGVYEALLARHPEELPDAELKVALGLHARSGRYLEAIAQRLPRHSLDGEVVEPVAPEHVHHAIVELYRRRQGRTQEDLRPKLIARLVEAIDASGLDRTAYTEQARVVKPDALALIDEAFAEHGRVTARREALQRAFAASGQTDVDAFADMYGIPLGEARRFLKSAT
ncbi:MAG: proq activator of osmoprotectant transporter prop, partial [Comamonadaceae bacterium]